MGRFCLALFCYLVEYKILPKTAKHKSGITVPVDAWNALKLAVFETFNVADRIKTELARRIERGESEARTFRAAARTKRRSGSGQHDYIFHAKPVR